MNKKTRNITGAILIILALIVIANFGNLFTVYKGGTLGANAEKVFEDDYSVIYKLSFIPQSTGGESGDVVVGESITFDYGLEPLADNQLPPYAENIQEFKFFDVDAVWEDAEVIIRPNSEVSETTTVPVTDGGTQCMARFKGLGSNPEYRASYIECINMKGIATCPEGFEEYIFEGETKTDSYSCRFTKFVVPVITFEVLKEGVECTNTQLTNCNNDEVCVNNVCTINSEPEEPETPIPPEEPTIPPETPINNLELTLAVIAGLSIVGFVIWRFVMKR